MNLFRAFAPKTVPKSSPTDIEEIVYLEGREVTILMRCHPQARRLKLMVDPQKGTPILTYPRGVSKAEALRFLHKNAGWTLKRLEELPDRIDFVPGQTLPYRGQDLLIRHDPTKRRAPYITEGSIVVSGDLAHLPRRLSDFLKARAKEAIKPLAREKAALLDRKPGRIFVRDQRTRWGSCAANGDLSFSWRLILAPPVILDYVVAHEVSHLVHMDHSPAFWNTVARVHPEWEEARAWLHREGSQLHRIG